MKKFPHQQFIEDNNLDIQTFPEMLQKRIKGFDELEEDLQHTTDEDKEKLLNKLESLSYELEEDLEEHFEDQLENNDEEEDEQPEISPEPIQEEPTPEPEPEPEPLEEPAPEPQEEIQEPTPEPEPEPVKKPTDEEILEGFVADKKHQVFPSELKERGFKTSLNSKRLLVGKFCLQKGKYDTCYKIIIKGE
ncbi:MAG: hypothetical protein IT234_02445 [Bacteroidia bacterium]|nr:hypothetical protein [Bacteroidia bacterium]